MNLLKNPNLDEFQGLEISPGHNTNHKENTYVSKENRPINHHGLRTLITNMAQSYENPDRKDLVFHHLGHILPHHQEILTKALLHQLYLFTGLSHDLDYPLWMKLLRTQNGGLRQVGSDWLKASDNLLVKMGIAKSLHQITKEKVHDPVLAYRLGHYELAILRLKELKDNHNNEVKDERKLLVRISMAMGNLNDFKFEDFDEETSLVLLASFLVHLSKRGMTIREDLIHRFETGIEKFSALWSNQNEDDRFGQLSHLINSQNFILVRQGKWDAVINNLNKISNSIIPKITNSSLRNHILGNSFFHRSAFAHSKGNFQEELNFLCEASFWDHGFSDYNYRMAQIFHDNQNPLAKEHYEMSLSTGPMNLESVNDFGVFLAEFGTKEELLSWENVASLLFNVNVEGGSQ